MGTVAIYTAIYGGYEAPKAQPDLRAEMVLFTDDRHLEAPGWEVRYEPLPNVASAMMRAKLWKCRPDLADLDADVSIWIDGSMTVKRPELAREMAHQIGVRDALFLRHPWRKCIYDEAQASRGPAKYAGQPMDDQVRHYAGEGHPRGWGLFATGMIVRRNTPTAAAFGDAWFHECERWSYQDQLSLPYLLRAGPPLLYGCIDDPWEYWWEIGKH